MTRTRQFALFLLIGLVSPACNADEDTNSLVATVHIGDEPVQLIGPDAPATAGPILSSISIQARGTGEATLRVTVPGYMGVFVCDGETAAIGFADPARGIGCTETEDGVVVVSELPSTRTNGQGGRWKGAFSGQLVCTGGVEVTIDEGYFDVPPP